MAEERTVSSFTWLTPPLRSKLAVASMARMTQIRQYYATEKQHSVSLFDFFGLPPHTPLQLRQKSHPRMKYFEAKAKNKKSSLQEPEITEPASDDTLWPSESGNNEPFVDKEFDLTARSTSFLNLDSSWLASVLTEKPTLKDENGPQVQDEKMVVPQVSNNNFSLSF